MNNKVMIVIVVVFSLLAFVFGYFLGNSSNDDTDETVQTEVVASEEGVVELSGEIDLNTQPFEVRIEPIDGNI